MAHCPASLTASKDTAYKSNETELICLWSAHRCGKHAYCVVQCRDAPIHIFLILIQKPEFGYLLMIFRHQSSVCLNIAIIIVFI